MRALVRIFSLCILLVAGSTGIYLYREHFFGDRNLAQLQQEKRDLERLVERLSAETRVAEVVVLNQKEIDGKLHTTLLFQELARDGSPLPPRQFTYEGKMAHIDAMVIKFDRGFIKQDDPLRGRSIALFTKLFGDHQKPEEAFRIDEPGKIPEFYRGADPRISSFEQELWSNFWRLADDEAFRREKGVRIAQGEGLWREFERGRLYTITIEADGGLNMLSEPMRPIYGEALRRIQS